MSIFKRLETNRIYLRALEPEDLDLLYQVENDPASWNASLNKMPYSRFFLKNYLESLTGDVFQDGKIRLIIASKEGENPLGIIDLYDISPISLKAETGIIIFEEYRGQAYGKEATMLLLDYAFKRLLLHQVYATTSATNEAAIALYKSCGFEQTGRFKDWQLTLTGFQDELLFQCFTAI